MARPRRAGGALVMSSPSSRMVPLDVSSRPAIRRSRVDLPQPEGPTKTTNSPSLMSREMSGMIWTSPKDFLTLRRDMEPIFSCPLSARCAGPGAPSPLEGEGWGGGWCSDPLKDSHPRSLPSRGREAMSRRFRAPASFHRSECQAADELFLAEPAHEQDRGDGEEGCRREFGEEQALRRREG